MSKKRKSHSELEHLRGLIRQLEKENKRLKRQLRQAEKTSLYPADYVEELEEVVVTSTPFCRFCRKGLQNIVDFGLKKYECCTVCDIRKPVK